MNIRLQYDANIYRSFVQVSSVTILDSPQLSLNKNVPLSSQTMVHETKSTATLGKNSQMCNQLYMESLCQLPFCFFVSCHNCKYLLIKFRIIDVKYKNSKNKRRTPLEIYEINRNISFGIRAHFCYSSSSASPSSSGSGSVSGVSTLAFAFASIPASSNGYKNDAIC